MKKFFNLLCLAAFTTSIFVACSKNDTSENLPVTNKKTVRFNAKSADTKTYFGDKTDGAYPTVWSSNEKVKIALNYGGTKGSAYDATVTPSSNGKTASFTVTIEDDESGEYTFYALSPAASSISWSQSYGSIQVDFPASQTPTSTSVDEKAHIMAAKSATFTTFPEETTPVTLAFSHIAAYGKFQFRELPETVTIQSIELTAEENVAGRFYFYPETGELTANSAGKSVTLDVSEIDIDKNNTTDFWFSFAPVNLEGKTLKVSVHTDAGVYAKTITFPTGKGNFQAGRVAAFTINMSGITPGEDQVYKILTDKKQLLPGAKAIIVAQDVAKAMSTTQNSNNRGNTDVDKSEDLQTITNPGDAVQVFVLEAGSVYNTVAFKCENGNQVDKYIYAASSSSNHLKSQATLDGNASFSVSIEDGYTILTANGANTRNIIKYNSDNNPPIFSCYASGQKEVVIYVLEGSGEGSSLIGDPKCPTPEISYNASTKTVTITCSATESRIGYTTDGTDPGLNDAGEPTGTTQEYTEPFTISETCTVKAFAGAPGYEMSEIAEKECVVQEVTYAFTTVAELNALATSNETEITGKLTDAVISFVPDTKNAIIKDATGSVLLYKSGHGFLQGQTFSGDLTVKLKLYYGSSEITAIDAGFTGTSVVVDPEVLTLNQLVGNHTKYQNAYVQVNELEVTAIDGKNVSVKNGDKTFLVYASAGVPTNLAVEDIISVVGTVEMRSGNQSVKAWTTNAITITQSHTPSSHTVTFDQPTAGGRFTVTVDGNTISSGDEVEEGATVTLTATAESGFSFTGWSVTGATVSGNTATATFTMGTSDVTIAASFSSQTGEKTATILFGSASGSTNINNTSVTGSDDQGNTWTITTVMNESSFTPQPGYAQIGAAKKPATSITFTTTLPSSANVKSFSAKFGGFSGTAGDVKLKVGNTVVGTGALDAGNDVTVQSNATASGTVLTVTVTNIAKGVKAYNIIVTYE